MDAVRGWRRRRDRGDRGVRARRSGEPRLRRDERAQRDDVRSRRSPVRLPLVRDPLVRERRLRHRRGSERPCSSARSSRRPGSTRCGSAAAWRTSACSHPAPAASRRRSPSRVSTTGSTSRSLPSSSSRLSPKRGGGGVAAGGDHPGDGQPVALLARGFYVREPSPTTSLTRRPGAIATPGSGDWWTTVPVRPGAVRARSRTCRRAASCSTSRRLEPTKFGSAP